jgi:hypothetical protein
VFAFGYPRRPVFHRLAPSNIFPITHVSATIVPMNSTPRGLPPSEVLKQLRHVCLELPEVREQRAWAGIRWNIGTKNFAHAVTIGGGWPPAYARAAGVTDACVVTFRLDKQRCAAPRFRRAPFFRPPWFPNIAGVVVDARTDWDEIASLVKDSYRVLAPKKLAALVE